MKKKTGKSSDRKKLPATKSDNAPTKTEMPTKNQKSKRRISRKNSNKHAWREKLVKWQKISEQKIVRRAYDKTDSKKNKNPNMGYRQKAVWWGLRMEKNRKNNWQHSPFQTSKLQ